MFPLIYIDTGSQLGISPQTQLALGLGIAEETLPLACTQLPCLREPRAHTHLDVAIVGPSMAIHALHRGRLPLHQMNSEQGLESHWVIHVRVVGRQVHPTNNEQTIYLWRGERAHGHVRVRMKHGGKGSPAAVHDVHPCCHTPVSRRTSGPADITMPLTEPLIKRMATSIALSTKCLLIRK